jgi:hypothetical protein
VAFRSPSVRSRIRETPRRAFPTEKKHLLATISGNRDPAKTEEE